MYKYIFTLSMALVTWACSPAQNTSPLPPFTEGLVAYYSFDNCDARDDTGGGSDGLLSGTPNCTCGVSGNALELDGLSDFITFSGIVNDYFDTDNFTVSFYIKPFGSPLKQTVLSKREDCGPENAFEITYTPTQNAITSELSEDEDKNDASKGTLNFNSCWHHVAIVRRGGKNIVYLDGEFKSETVPTPSSRVDIENNARLAIGNNPCIGSGINRFKGYIDELAIYSEDLTESAVQALYIEPDRILTENQTLYLGDSLEIETSSNCVDNYLWTPLDGVSDPISPNPVIIPTVDTTYRLEFRDQNGCIALDTVHLKIIDPATLSCEKALLPKAFTPNGDGPAQNETFGISNHRIIELVSFEIFDRWGERVFQTDNASERWDGNFQGTPLNPGVFLYKIQFNCKGETKKQFGSLSLIR